MLQKHAGRKEKEVWRDVPGHEGRYQVSNIGQVRSVLRVTYCGHGCQTRQVRKGRVLRQFTDQKNRHAYASVYLYEEGRNRTRTVHRLVAQVFIPNPSNKPEVNHKDCDKKNNHVSNLEWVTKQENTDHAVAAGRIKQGNNHSRSALNESEVREIKRALLSKCRRGLQAKLARRYKVGFNIINNISRGLSYKHVVI